METLLKVSADISQCISKIVLSIILIRVLGISGLGLATFCSYIVAAIILTCHFFRKKNSIKISAKLNLADLWPSLKLSFGKASAFLRSTITQFIINVVIVRVLGSDYLPIFSILTFLASFGGVPRRISLSLAPMVTMAYSTKNKNDYDFCIAFYKKFSLIFCPIFSIFTMAISPLILMLYNIAPGSSLYIYGILAIVIFSISYYFSTHSRAYGDFYVSIQISSIYIVTEVITLILDIGLTVGFTYLFGIIGLIVGFSLSQILTFVILLVYLCSKNKDHKGFKALEVDEDQFSVDLVLSKDNIKSCIQLFREYIANFNVNEELANNILFEIKEATEAILRLNPNKKVINRITMCIGKDTIRIFNKNNGRLIPLEEKQSEMEKVDEHPHFNALYQVSDFAMYGSSTFNCAYLNIPKY